MVDRAARDEMAELIRRYCAGELGSSALDDRVMELQRATDDDTLSEVCSEVWLTYDDLIDHPIHVPRPCWDYLQRLLLLLDSDGEIVDEHARRWTWRQPVAAAGVLTFIAAAAQLLPGGWRPGAPDWLATYYLLCLPFAGLWHLLEAARFREHWRRQAGFELLTPYASVSEMLRARRRVPEFRKMRYRPEIGQQPPIRGPIRQAICTMPAYVVLAALAPLMLAYRTFPETETRRHVALPPTPPDAPRRSPNPCPAAG